MELSFTARLADEVKQAMRARDSVRLGALRMLQAAIKQKEIDERHELSNDECIAIVEKQVKQRRESIAAFEQAGREDSVAQERAELAVLQVFLPQAAAPEEIEQAILEVLTDLAAEGVTGGPAMGKAMAAVKTRLAGRADMAQVSAQIKQRLART